MTSKRYPPFFGPYSLREISLQITQRLKILILPKSQKK